MTTDTIELQGTCIVMHGPPKAGKTQLASSFPGPVVFLATEDGHRFVPKDQRDLLCPLRGPRAWELFAGRLKSKAKGQTIYEYLDEIKPKTVVIDTVSNLSELCASYICDKNKWATLNDGSYGSGWAEMKKEFALGIGSFLQWTEAHNATRIFIDHSRTEEINLQFQTYTKLSVSMDKRARDIVLAAADHIWMVAYGKPTDRKVSDANLKDTAAQTRCLYISAGNAIEAGTRDPRIEMPWIESLPKSGQYDYIMNALNNGAGDGE